MRKALAYLTEEHGAPPLSRYVPKVTPPAPRAITATREETDKILSACPLWLRCWVLLCSDLAMRNATASSISPSHYDAGTGTVTFQTKFGSWQTLPVTHELATIFNSIKLGKVSTPYIVLLHPLKRMSKTWPGQKFSWVRRQAGITRKLTPHDLRRTTALAVFNQNHDLRTVQAVLGHKRLETTLWYLDHRNTSVAASTLELAKLPTPTKGVQ